MTALEWEEEEVVDYSEEMAVCSSILAWSWDHTRPTSEETRSSHLQQLYALPTAALHRVGPVLYERMVWLLKGEYLSCGRALPHSLWLYYAPLYSHLLDALEHLLMRTRERPFLPGVLGRRWRVTLKALASACGRQHVGQGPGSPLLPELHLRRRWGRQCAYVLNHTIAYVGARDRSEFFVLFTGLYSELCFPSPSGVWLDLMSCVWANMTVQEYEPLVHLLQLHFLPALFVFCDNHERETDQEMELAMTGLLLAFSCGLIPVLQQDEWRVKQEAARNKEDPGPTLLDKLVEKTMQLQPRGIIAEKLIDDMARELELIVSMGTEKMHDIVPKVVPLKHARLPPENLIQNPPEIPEEAHNRCFHCGKEDDFLSECLRCRRVKHCLDCRSKALREEHILFCFPE